MPEKIIEFLRKKDFRLIKELGQGGFGRTVLLHDSTIDEQIVCKKYSPHDKLQQKQYFTNFVQEIKILYQVNHPNIVRVFNYYLYPERQTGYILMEYVKGQDVEDHLSNFPENANKLFLQTIEGFAYLEQCNILHRDIRPQNIMVGENASVKIIDFGFGKQALAPGDFDKSISLNWPFEPPSEFGLKIYNFQTEIYFVGKLFEKLVRDNLIEHFEYKGALHSMCQIEPSKRASSFADIKAKIFSNKFSTIDFSDEEREFYREFSLIISKVVSGIPTGTKYFEDIDKVQLKLEALHQRVMLEEHLPDQSAIAICLINGAFRYNTNAKVDTSCLENFIKLLRGCSKEKKNIILGNLHSRLDSVSRYSRNLDDEVPF